MKYVSASYVSISDHGAGEKPLTDITSFGWKGSKSGTEGVKTINPKRRVKGKKIGAETYEITFETAKAANPEVDWFRLWKTSREFTLSWVESTDKNLFDGEQYTAQGCMIVDLDNGDDGEGNHTVKLSLIADDVDKPE